MSSILLVAILALLILVLAGAVVAFVLVGRRGARRLDSREPIAAPGMDANRAEAASLLLDLTDNQDRHATELEFARLQLPTELVTGYEAATAEALSAADELSRAVTQTRDSDGRGPSGTQEAGVLAAAVGRAKRASQRLRDQEAAVAEARRRLPPG